MPKIEYIPKRFNSERAEKIEKANQIIEEYRNQGFELTLRQLYYQFVARGLIPNNQREYKNLGDTINDARLAGLVDWEAIVDRTRNLRSNSHWDSPGKIISSCASQYRLDRWEGQQYRPEVWIEKNALVGIIEGVCRRNDTPYFACIGYASASELWAAAQRLIKWSDGGQKPLILHFGDHDPSGCDMTRDIRDRLELLGASVEVERLALNMEQIRRYNPPPNPAKTTDSRCADYQAEHGAECWELDALEPAVIEQLIQDRLDSIIDRETWSETERQEKRERKQLGQVSKRWKEVVAEL